MCDVKYHLEKKAMVNPMGGKDTKILYENYPMFCEQVMRIKKNIEPANASMLFVNANFDRLKGYEPRDSK